MSQQTMESPRPVSAARLLRGMIAGDDSPRSLAARARRRRWRTVLEHFPALETYRVLDLGGTPQFWTGCPVRPAHITVVNLEPPAVAPAPSVEVIVGDACEAQTVLKRRDFDLVFSNSTIEHVGGHDRFAAFAKTVRQLAPRHWVQTPYRYFPLEPHFLFPCFQFLPVAMRRHIVAHWPLSHARAAGGGIDDPIGVVVTTELLSRTQLQYYFPQSTIVAETVLGLPKSIVAVLR